MKHLWFFFVLVFTQESSSSLTCASINTNCTCFSGTDLELQCPASHNSLRSKFILHIDKSTTKIDCYEVDTFEIDLLPVIPPQDRYRLEIRFCPPPKEGFKSISDHLSMTSLSVLQFETSNQSVTLNKESFAGLKLERLKLNVLNFTTLDEDVFGEIPDLYSLELEKNTDLKLKKDTFRNLTHLKLLYLGTNDLEVLQDDLFSPLVSLNGLYLWNNKLVEINSTFQGLRNLTSLDLSHNKINRISPGAFTTLEKLSSLNLSGNELTTLDIFTNQLLEVILLQFNPQLQLPEFLFAGLKELQLVDLSHCNLTVIPRNVFENCSKLSEINLESNSLEVVPMGLFQGLYHLKKLNLQENRLRWVDPNVFEDLLGLTHLNLALNQLGGVSVKSEVLEELDLGCNRIKRFFDVEISQGRMQRLDLSNNSISELVVRQWQPMSFDLELILDNNNITKINLEEVEHLSSQLTALTTISLLGNPLECDCDLYETQQFQNLLKFKNATNMFVFEGLTCRSPQRFEGANLEELAPSDLTCDLSESRCPGPCNCLYRPDDLSVVIDCSNQSLVEFPNIDHKLERTYKQIEVHLEWNLLKTGPRKSQGYEDVTKLYLSHNGIRKVEWLPLGLKVLRLDNNELKGLNSSLLKELSLEELSLDGNQWGCDCSAVNFTNFLREHAKTLDTSKVFCKHSKQLLVNLTSAELCHSNFLFYLLLSLFLLIFFFMVVLVLFFRFKEELKIWLFANNLCLSWVTEEDLDKDKLYDAFISYSHKDEEFVIQNLVPNLENGPNPYKLCLHFRNWIPGEYISTQITNSVLESRRTLVVLSPSFLESVWGKMEFRTAHTQAMTEGRARVIIVLYGDVDLDRVDDELKAYMKMNTYVKWGDPYFWRKLTYALPHSKKGGTNSQKMANVMSCIDDKFNLMVSDKTAVSTPPILSMDGEGLKRGMMTPPAEGGMLV